MERKILKGLSPEEYEHPFDRKALNALKGTPGLEPLVKKFNQYWNDKVLKIQYTGSNIKVNKNNFPDVYNALYIVCETLDFSPVPSLYINWGYEVNAFTAGVHEPIIVLNSGCIDLLSFDELLFVIGHEVGHIKSQHVLYSQMASILPVLGSILGNATLGIGELVSTGIQIALLNWSRMSEFTSDRAGLLACQSLDSAITALMKIAGIPMKYFNSMIVDDFIAQAKEFESYDLDALDKIAKIMSIMWQSHPWTVMRSAQFIEWVDSGSYQDIIRRHSFETNDHTAGEYIYCTQCGSRLYADANFCSKCGKKVR